MAAGGGATHKQSETTPFEQAVKIIVFDKNIQLQVLTGISRQSGVLTWEQLAGTIGPEHLTTT